MLVEEADAFAMSDDDVGCVPELEMDIGLTSDQPVQKNYISIPRPLYPEVKGYIEDLLNRGFIRKSKSPFSSSVVCVCKKDGTMRLCIDHRELNKKTVPDRHPIPRIQEALDILGGSPGLVFWIRERPIIRVLLERKVSHLLPVGFKTFFLYLLSFSRL